METPRLGTRTGQNRSVTDGPEFGQKPSFVAIEQPARPERVRTDWWAENNPVKLNLSNVDDY